MTTGLDDQDRQAFLDRAQTLERLFSPRSVAVIGASPDDTRVGGRVVRHLLRAAYPGTIYPVNPRYTEIDGLRCYPHVDALPGPADVAVVAIPADKVVAVVEECTTSGIRSVVVFAGGFAEVGELGELRQKELGAVLSSTGTRLLGPNCLGTINTSSRLMATFTAVDVAAVEPGGVGLVTQSGLVGTYFLRLAQRRRLGFSTWAATGNELDIGAPECIARLALDDETDVIALHLETVRNGGQLCAAFEVALEREKPVVVLKSGRSDLGQRVTTSHTAGMATSDEVFDSVCERYGVHRVTDLHAMLDVVEGLVRTPMPSGNRLCALTISGGFGALIADEAVDAGLVLPDVPEDVRCGLQTIAPYLPVMNPVDIADQLIRDPGILVTYVNRLVATGAYDLVLTFLGQVAEDPDVIDRFVAAMAGSTLPLFMSGVTSPELESRLRGAGIPLFENPTDAIRTIGALSRHAARSRAASTVGASIETSRWPEERINATRHRVTIELERARQETAVVDRWPLSESTSRDLLELVGVHVVTGAVADDEASLARRAGELGYPVVLKANARDISHKSDIGAVVVGIEDEEALLEARACILDNVSRHMRGVRLEGLLVARLERGGLEAIVGLSRDPTFGAVILVGTGGTATEAIGDYRLAHCPVTLDDARRLIASTQLGRVMEHRHMRDRYATDGLVDLVVRLSEWATLDPRVVEVDLNPVLVRGPDQGVVALDAHVVLGTEHVV